MSSRKFLFIIILLLFSFSVKAQISSASIGASIHAGSIQGNNLPVTSLGGTVFFDFFPWFENDVSFRFGYTYSQMINYFLPENRTDKYYPFVKVLSLKGFIRQDFTFPIYIEEGAGFIYLNDRTEVNTNQWELGAGFNAQVGYDFRKSGDQGFCLGLGLEYGVAFTKTTANYYLFYFQSQYYF
jgi:hypothetical protein